MLHMRVYKVLKSCILLGILLTLIIMTWLICYSAYEDGFHPSEFPDSNYGGKIVALNIHLHGTENKSGRQTEGTNIVKKQEVHASSEISIGAIGATSEQNFSSHVSQEITINNPIPQEIDAKDTAGKKLQEHNITGASTMRHRGGSVGHVIAVTFWDQQTFSVGRLLSLQCWAGHHDMLVVEPFMINSKFGAPLTAEAMKHNDTMVRLGRLYDLDHWNEYSKKRGYAPMVEWKEFLHQAPRDVIIVEFKGNSLQALRKEYSKTLNPHGFQVVKELHLDYKSPSNKLSMDDFATHMFGNYSPSDVTVIFSEWTLIVNNVVDLASVHCHATHTDYDAISPSKEISESAEAYIENQFGGGEYNTVMLRLEFMPEPVSSCLSKTVQRLDKIKNYTGNLPTFVAIDVGKYGSKTDTKFHGSMFELVQGFLRIAYDNSSSLNHWEKTFEDISKSTSPGYIGFLQKVIAIRAKYILLTGSGTNTFQRHALNMYKDLHKETKDACYAVVGTRPVCSIQSSEGIVLD